MPISRPDARAISAIVSPGRMFPAFEFLDERDRVGGRCGVAVSVDGDNGIVSGSVVERCGYLGHAFAYCAGGGLVGDHVSMSWIEMPAVSSTSCSNGGVFDIAALWIPLASVNMRAPGSSPFG